MLLVTVLKTRYRLREVEHYHQWRGVIRRRRSCTRMAGREVDCEDGPGREYRFGKRRKTEEKMSQD